MRQHAWSRGFGFSGRTPSGRRRYRCCGEGRDVVWFDRNELSGARPGLALPVYFDRPDAWITGTVIGMVEAFDAIEQAGDISPSLVAGGIKVALLTTLFGLIVAIILQLFYNYATSKIDRLVAEMEEASIELIDSLVLMKAGQPVVSSEEQEEAATEQPTAES